MYYSVQGKIVALESMNTSSEADQKVQGIFAYLRNMLQQHGTAVVTAHSVDLWLDVGAFGPGRLERPAAVHRWQAATAVYPIRLCSSQCLLGPLYHPGQKQESCPECLALRWLRNLPKEEQYALLFSPHQVSIGTNPHLLPFALESMWSVLEILLSGTLLLPTEADHFYTLSLKTLKLGRYQLIQDPSCPVCGDIIADTPEATIIPFSARQKRSPSQYHLVDATSYAFPLEGLINPVCGMLGTNAYKDIYNTILSPVTGLFKVNGTYTTRDAKWGGHGNSYRHSLALGLLEGFERYAGHMPRAKSIALIDSYNNLAPDAVNPLEYGLYTPDVYQRNHPYFEPFTVERKIRWIWGYSCLKQRPVLVPEQLVYYWNYHQEASYVQSCSNGCATGSCFEEAIFYGLMELVERDTFMLAWYARLALPKIDPQSDQRREIKFVLEAIDKEGYDLTLLDARLDLKFPSVIALARRRDNQLGQTILASGASLNADDALKRALYEVASYLASFAPTVERLYAELRPMVDDYSKVVQLRHHSLLHGLPEMKQHTDFFFANPLHLSIQETYRSWKAEAPENLDLLADLQYCLNTFLAQGRDIIVVDQTCPEQEHLGLKTVCVLVPGLLPIDFGWDRHRVLSLPRLRSVPRTAGFYKTDLSLEQVNLVPHPFP